MGRTTQRGIIPLLCGALVAVGCESVLGLDDARTRATDASPAPSTATDASSVETVDAAESGSVTDVGPAPSASPPYVVASQGQYTCAVGADGRAYCWGDNADGQVGDGTTEQRDHPVPVGEFTDVVDVSAGYTHSCLVRANSDVYCWGKNDRGQLGDDTKENRHEPVLAMSGATRVGVAGWHTCAVTQLRGVRCWGDGYYGALGDGAFERRAKYVDVQGLSDVVALAVGVMHNCAVTAQGHVYCWGRSGFGQLGYEVDGGNGSPDPSDPGSAFATRVVGLTDIAEITAGEDHTCAGAKDGKIYCWGRNDYAQLGDGTKSYSRTEPALVQGGVTYGIHFGAGQFTSCATFTGGSVRCWGQNNFGQLGNGNTTPGPDVPSPEVAGLLDIEVVATGEHTCAWRKAAADGPRTLYCWGRNDMGQLGIGRISDYELKPQEVTFPPAPNASP